MGNKFPRVLILSSVSLTIGPAKIAEDYYKALRAYGLECDLLLLKEENDHPEYFYVRANKEYTRSDAVRLWTTLRLKPQQFKCNFFYTYEWLPLISPHDITDAIHKQYDLVITVFWQEGFSFQTMKAIYDKIHCLFIFACVDYSTMSGGCHFFGDCERYKYGCGYCVQQGSNFKYDFTFSNVRYRKRFIKKIKPVIRVNHYLKQFYNQSYLWKGYNRMEISPAPTIDTDIFKPLDKIVCREKYNIIPNKKFVIMFASQYLTNPRKGIDYFIEALQILKNRFTKEQASNILVLGVGREHEKVAERIPFDFKAIGYVPIETLPELFSISDCFICSSVNDAGPMMVNQSLCCGTPVVGFDMGAVQSVVKNKGTGYCAKLKDSEDLAQGIETIYCLTKEEKNSMSQKCREVALSTSSYNAFAQSIVDIYSRWR